MTRVFSRGRFGAAAVLAAVGAATVPALASASTSGTASLPLTGGTLSINSLAASATLPATNVSAGTVSGALNSGTWADTTGSGNGWNGTIQLAAPFLYQGTWTQTSGAATALSSSASGTYTGQVANALITVTVTASTVAATTVSWTDREATTSNGTNTVCNAVTTCAIASGITISFAAAVYPTGATYQVEAGTLPTTSMTLSTPSATGPTATGTTLGGANLPVFENTGTTVPAGGSAVSFVHATTQTGMGSFSLAPGVTITWDPNNTWGGSGVTYSTTAQYAIVAGP